jgi:hypothetical protein
MIKVFFNKTTGTLIFFTNKNIIYLNGILRYEKFAFSIKNCNIDEWLQL